MGAKVVHDGNVEFRFQCKPCAVTGYNHGSADEARADARNHHMDWHTGNGTPTTWNHGWCWHCFACDHTYIESVSDSEAGAWEAGWQHQMSWHHHDFFIEQLGSYEVDEPESGDFIGPPVADDWVYAEQ